MPELPDLQVFSQNLTRLLAGKKLTAIDFGSIKITEAEKQAMEKSLKGHKVSTVYREGKELRFAFDNENILGMHLMLRGKLEWVSDEQILGSLMFAMDFGKNAALCLTDPRKMARVFLNPEKNEVPDALSDHFTEQYLLSKFQSSRAAVKNIITDQKFVRGIGNAYADEIFWEARISPFSIAEKVPKKEVQQLARSIKKVLLSAEKQIIKEHPQIIGGEIRDFLKIHHPDKSKSPTGSPILKVTGAGSSTYYTGEQVLYK